MSLIRSLRRQWDTRNAGWTLAEEQVAGLENGGRKAPNEASGPFPSVKRRNRATVGTGRAKAATYSSSDPQMGLPW